MVRCRYVCVVKASLFFLMSGTSNLTKQLGDQANRAHTPTTTRVVVDKHRGAAACPPAWVAARPRHRVVSAKVLLDVRGVAAQNMSYNVMSRNFGNFLGMLVAGPFILEWYHTWAREARASQPL